jgi:uncharacterized protein with HEPN domain
MPRSPKAHLFELQKACRYLMRKAEGVDLDEYLGNEDLQFIIERNFIHIGEVMAQLRREFPEVALQFVDAARIVDFRNFILHRYWDVDDQAVWLTLTTKVAPLLQEVEVILLKHTDRPS